MARDLHRTIRVLHPLLSQMRYQTSPFSIHSGSTRRSRSPLQVGYPKYLIRPIGFRHAMESSPDDMMPPRPMLDPLLDKKGVLPAALKASRNPTDPARLVGMLNILRDIQICAPLQEALDGCMFHTTTMIKPSEISSPKSEVLKIKMETEKTIEFRMKAF